MNFKCICGSKYYKLTKTTDVIYTNKGPQTTDLYEDNNTYWSAECSNCDEKWACYRTSQILEQVMIDAGVLK